MMGIAARLWPPALAEMPTPAGQKQVEVFRVSGLLISTIEGTVES